MPKAPTNADRDRTIANLITLSRSLMVRLDEVAMVLNNHADVLKQFQKQLDAVTLTAALQTTGERQYADQA